MENEITFQVHWLSFTVHAQSENAFTLYEIFFKDIFGDLIELGHGGRSFKEIYHGLLEIKLYLNPVNQTLEPYFHFEIPGQACEALGGEYFKALLNYLESNFPDKYKFKRLDFAFDNLKFTPQLVEQAIIENNVRSLAKRETLEIHSSPFKPRDNGELGTYTVDFGSRSSERMIRVYNKRGYTRLEIEMKNKRADLVAREIFNAPDSSFWFQIMVSHLRDYIDFKTDWWDFFINEVVRAKATVSNPKEMASEKMFAWLNRQISPAISTAYDIMNDSEFESFINQGRKRRGPRYEMILQNASSRSHGEGSAPPSEMGPQGNAAD